MSINKNTIDFVWNIAQKRDITIAGINGIANLSNTDDKISITLYLDSEPKRIVFHFLEIGKVNLTKDFNSLIGFMHEKDAPKEFINRATKKGENILLLSKNDLCLALLDIMNFIKG